MTGQTLHCKQAVGPLLQLPIDASASAPYTLNLNPVRGWDSGSAFLDLHGLHIKEACAVLKDILQQRQQRQRAGGGQLTVCVGVSNVNPVIFVVPRCFLLAATTFGVEDTIKAQLRRHDICSNI